MISFKLGRLHVHMLGYAGMVVLFGHGIKYTCNPPYFSERYGYVRPFARLLGYRFFYVRRAWL